MTIHYVAGGTLEVAGAEHAGRTAKKYAAIVAWSTAEAVKAGMEGPELRGYIKGLSEMAGAFAEIQTGNYNRAILEWDEAMAEAGEELPQPAAIRPSVLKQ